MSLRTRASALSCLLAVACASNVRDAVPSADRAELRARIERTLPLLQGSMEIWIQEQECISCHHQGLGSMAVTMARERDIAIDAELHRRQVERLLATAPGGALHGDAGINATFGRSFQLVALAAADVPRDARTDALAYFLAGNAVPRGERTAWWSESFRPPLEASSVTGTAFALRALDLYRPDARAEETARTLAAGRRWLEACEPRDGEERALRLLGLGWSGAPAESVRAAADDLLAWQRADGGWAQLATMPSDAYATGQALVALQQIGGLAIDSPAFQGGLRFLLDTQLEDGSWRVETRRRSPGLEYFETGFPHQKHQFISTAATAWAVMALCCALDAQPATALRGARPARAELEFGLGLAPIHLAAAFGTLDELRSALDGGADPNARGAEDLTPLHLAVRDPQFTVLLLERGAAVDARTARGATPLLLAAWYAGGERSARLLLQHGADVHARAGDGMTPLLRAVVAGKLELVRELLLSGADLRGEAGDLGALNFAATQGDLPMVALLFDAGLDADTPFDGDRPLHWASHDGKDDVVRLLLEHGADVNARDAIGMTPLAWAARVEHGNERTLRALLEAGADPGVTCELGRTPLDWARQYDNEQALAALEPAGAVR